MNVEMFNVAANLCLEPKFSSGRHRPHSRLNDWHTIDYDEELFTDLSYCNKSKPATDLHSSIHPDFNVLTERKCSTSTPLISKNPDKYKDTDASICLKRLLTLKESNETCDSGFGESDVINTLASCTLQTPISLLNSGHRKCSNFNLESDCPIFDQPLPCVSLESLFENNHSEVDYQQWFLQKDISPKQAQISHESDSGFESQYSESRSQTSSNVKQENISDSGYTNRTGSDIKQELSFTEKITELLEKFSPKNPDALIGRRIGQKHVDVVALLHTKNIDPAIWKICGYLNGHDLSTIRSVSRAWNSAVESRKCIKHRWQQYVESQRVPLWNKENQTNKSPRKQAGLTGGKDIPLASLQPTASKSQHTESRSPNVIGTPTCTKSEKTGPLTRHQLFVKAASTLKVGECLRKCPLCHSPSRTDAIQERAWCMGNGCRYDFCIKCRSPFHGSKPCTTGISKKTRTEGGGVGSKKSKKSLRRL